MGGGGGWVASTPGARQWRQSCPNCATAAAAGGDWVACARSEQPYTHSPLGPPQSPVNAERLAQAAGSRAGTCMHAEPSQLGCQQPDPNGPGPLACEIRPLLPYTMRVLPSRPVASGPGQHTVAPTFLRATRPGQPEPRLDWALRQGNTLRPPVPPLSPPICLCSCHLLLPFTSCSILSASMVTIQRDVHMPCHPGCNGPTCQTALM